MINRRTLVQLVLSLYILDSFAQPVRADTVTLRPVADTSLSEPAPDSNLGNTALTVGSTRFGARNRALIKFNPGTNIPPGAVISAVRLTMQVVKAPGAAANSNFELHRVLVNWGEGTGGTPGPTRLTGNPAAKTGEASWQARQAPSTFWSVPGASAPDDFVETASGSAVSVRQGSFAFASTPQMVADFQAWVNDPGTNFGWIVISQAEGTVETARRISSRETGSTAPSLVVTFTATPPPTPPTIVSQPQAQTVYAGETAAFSVTASGSSPLNYQWSLNQTNLAGATNSAISIANAQTSNAGSYTVTITNSAGSITSSTALLTLVSAPVIQIVTQSSSALNLSFAAQAGHNYFVEFRDSFSIGGWQTLTNFNALTSTNAVVSTSISTSERYYRLRAAKAP